MAEYKLFCLDAGGVLQAGETIQAASQKEALALAAARLERHHRVELWQGAVRIWTGSRPKPAPKD